MRRVRHLMALCLVLMVGGVQGAESRGTQVETPAMDSSAAPPSSEAPSAESPRKRRLTGSEIRANLRKLGDEDIEVRRQAHDTLVAGGKFTASYLKAYLKNYDDDERLRAIPVLEVIDNEFAEIAVAKRAVFDAERRVRLRAAEAVRTMGGRTAMGFIIGKALDTKERVRFKAARAICNIGDPSYIPALIGPTMDQMRSTQGSVGASFHLNSAQPRQRTVVVTTSGKEGGQVWDVPLTQVEVASWDGRLSGTVLATLTRREYGTNLKMWSSWWKKNRRTFTFPNLETEGEE